MSTKRRVEEEHDVSRHELDGQTYPKIAGVGFSESQLLTSSIERYLVERVKGVAPSSRGVALFGRVGKDQVPRKGLGDLGGRVAS